MNRVGVIDIGSNTVRAVVCEDEEIVYNKAVFSRIFGYTENGIFTAEGFCWLADIISELRAAAPDCDKFYAYATSAFRDLKNGDEVAKFVLEKTGIEISILSETDEAMCDLLALGSLGVTDGLGIDLGGGSCQIFELDNGNPGKFASLPIGCNRLCKKFVVGDIPADEEILRLTDYATGKANGFGKTDKLFVLGGTSLLALKIRRISEGVSGDEITPDELWEIVRSSHNESGLSVIKKVAKERYCSAIVGFAIIAALADKFGAKCVKVCGTSSREGFLIMKNKEKTEL